MERHHGRHHVAELQRRTVPVLDDGQLQLGVDVCGEPLQAGELCTAVGEGGLSAVHGTPKRLLPEVYRMQLVI